MPDRVRAKGHLSGRYPGDEVTASGGFVVFEFDGEDVQVSPFNEVDDGRVVHRERPMGSGFDPDAAYAFDERFFRHRVNPT